MDVEQIRDVFKLGQIVTKQRKCMRCDRTFKSDGNRLCNSCHITNDRIYAHGDYSLVCSENGQNFEGKAS